MTKDEFKQEILYAKRAYDGPKDVLRFWIGLKDSRPDLEAGCGCGLCRSDPLEHVRKILTPYGFQNNPG